MSNNLCQFYVILGDSSFRVPNDSNVYINATGIYDYKKLQDEIFRVYKEKAKLGIKVASEIIFLVNGISASDRAREIINQLRLKGKIEVIRKEERKQVVEKVVPTLVEEEKKPVVEMPRVDEMPPMPPVRDSFEVSEKVNKVDNEIKKERNFLDIDKKEEVEVREEKVSNTNEVKLPDNVYKRNIEVNSYSGYIGKPVEKKTKFNKLPLIIFIISLILFIGSVVLLFVL